MKDVKVLMPELIEDLKRLVAIPSCAFPGFPSEPVHAAAGETRSILERSGVSTRLIDIPGGYPAVFGEIEGPPGAPTVLLYAHYDVQPAPAEQGWTTDPFTATERDGRLYGRGAADDKSGIAIHAGALRAFDGRPPVNVKVLIEGEEETNGNLETYVAAHPELVQADAIVIADSGNPRVGEPALTTALRGMASCDVRLTALDNALHSGMFGGVMPDALLALTRLLASLHRDDGSLAVEGLAGSTWDGADIAEDELRSMTGLSEDKALIGTGSIASRLWAMPALSVIGLDVPHSSVASNVVLPTAAARLSLRVPPGASPRAEMDKVVAHLQARVPWGLDFSSELLNTGEPFSVDTGHVAVTTAARALQEAFGRPSGEAGSGGSIPLVATMQEACPTAGIILWGAEDTALARIHAGNESVDLGELERMVVAEARLFELLAEQAVQ